MTRRLTTYLMTLLVAVATWAQDTTTVSQGRHITPVRPSTNVVKQPGRDVSPELIEQYITGDTLAAQRKAREDSVRRSYPRYPRLTSLWLGANFIDPLLMALGQDYASTDVHATLNLWNRLQPTLELGLGWGKTTPDDMNFTYRAKTRPDERNFTYRAKPSPYVKVGVNYNFLFKSRPDYQAFVGLRLGASTFSYDVDAHYYNSYWQEEQQFNIRGERSNALWGEVLAGLKVKIYDRWSLGWTVRWHHLFKCKNTEHGRPWYIPGYGPRSRALTFSISAYYTLPLSQEKWPKRAEKVKE